MTVKDRIRVYQQQMDYLNRDERIKEVDIDKKSEDVVVEITEPVRFPDFYLGSQFDRLA